MRTSARVALLTIAGVLSACAASTTGGATPTSVVATDAPSTAPASAGQSDPAAGLTSDPLHAVALVDVRTGERVTIGVLAEQKPLLLETMAIWCTNCRGQQGQVVEAHALADFHSISLDVDPNERAADLADYAEREGFDWVFALADADLARLLRERFGTAVLNPPSMPKILFRTDGSVELIGLGTQLSASEVAAAVGG